MPYAKCSCPAGDPCDLLALLHGPNRFGLRLVMILLSCVLDLDGTRGGQWDYGRWGVRGQVGQEVLMEVGEGC
jgi:hypothetical protein